MGTSSSSMPASSHFRAQWPSPSTSSHAWSLYTAGGGGSGCTAAFGELGGAGFRVQSELEWIGCARRASERAIDCTSHRCTSHTACQMRNRNLCKPSCACCASGSGRCPGRAHSPGAGAGAGAGLGGGTALGSAAAARNPQLNCTRKRTVTDPAQRAVLYVWVKHGSVCLRTCQPRPRRHPAARPP